MRILLTTEFFLSGQSTHVIDLATQLKKFKCQVEILFTGIHTKLFNDFYARTLRNAGIQFYYSKNRQKIFQLTKSFKPDIIHSHSSTIFNLTQELAHSQKCPYVVTCHGLGFAHPKYGQSLKHAHRIIAVGKNSAAEIPLQHQNKTIIIPNGIDLNRFSSGSKETQLNVYYVGRIDWSKVRLLEHLHYQIKKIPQLNLQVIGNWKPPIKDLNYRPWRTDIENLFKSANIVIGCGRTAREALASGCVVLLLNKKYDGIIDPQLVGEPNFDFTGNLGRFSLSRLNLDLEKLATSRKKIRRLQQFGQNYAHVNLSSELMATKIIKVYRRALNEV